jgi:4-hydroxy-3-polyprenylbenzoate decarboxylase
MRVHKVFARENAIWPFTVVGRPPQEDTSFGQLIHEITGTAIPKEIPGLREVHAVDAAGVHPLLLAIGSERYTPYAPLKQPAEILTIANHILGTGQLSLAKFLFITADDTNTLSTYNVNDYLQYLLRRIDLERDIHFYTKTTIDTLDYSGESLNAGSKVVFAAYGEPLRELCTDIPDAIKDVNGLRAALVMPGVVAIQTDPYTSAANAENEAERLNILLSEHISGLQSVPLLVWCDDASFTATNMRNFLWVAFTRANPSHDIYGIGAYIKHKHWSARGPVIIDARIKPHHAPPVEIDPKTEKLADRIFAPGGSLHGVL